jgi:hypothetical protein
MPAARGAGNPRCKSKSPFGELKLFVSYSAGWFVCRLLMAAAQEPATRALAREAKRRFPMRPTT